MTPDGIKQVQADWSILLGDVTDKETLKTVWRHWVTINEALSFYAKYLAVKDTHRFVPIEPDDAMIRVGVAVGLSATFSPEYSWPQYMRDLYKTMLSASNDPLLKEEKPE